MASKAQVLLLGGHGKVAQFLTSKLLAGSYSVTSIIRDESQIPALEKLGENQPGKIKVLVRSLDDIKTQAQAQILIDEAKPSIVVWAAGAGGKGGAARTEAIDRDAAKAVIAASVATASVKKLLTVSALVARNKPAPWWDQKSVDSYVKANEAITVYCKAKLAADEYLRDAAAQRNEKDPAFQAITLRPGTLLDEAAKGKVQLGKTPAIPGIPREDVAAVAYALLDRDDTRGWIDLVGGNDSIDAAVEQVASQKIDAVEA